MTETSAAFAREIMSRSLAFERRVSLDDMACGEINKILDNILDSREPSKADMKSALWRISYLLSDVGRREKNPCRE
jgi:hypothetical protein